MTDASLADKVAYLSRTDAHPCEDGPVEVVSTHFAYVFLVGRTALKLKKPIRYELIDLRSLDARFRDCRAEARLNQRLAPGVYHGVVPLTCDGHGSLQLDGAGQVVDWLVHMRRITRADSLERRIADGRLGVDDVHRAGDCLGRFYRHLAPIACDPAVYPRELLGAIRSDLARLETAPLDLRFDQLRDVVARVVDHAGDLLEARARDERIVEGHGDLRPEHVIIGDDHPDGVAVMDALTFDRRYRIVDPVDELAALAVECDRLGARWVGEELIDRYRRQAGDPVGDRLLTVYEIRRAVLWARLHAARLADPDSDDDARYRRSVADYVDVALAAASRPRAG